jgi:biotin transporter BioY
MRGNREPITYWISKGKNGHALLALFINSRLAIVITVMLAAIILAALGHPIFATVGTGIGALFSATGAIRR